METVFGYKGKGKIRKRFDLSPQKKRSIASFPRARRTAKRLAKQEIVLSEKSEMETWSKPVVPMRPLTLQKLKC